MRFGVHSVEEEGIGVIFGRGSLGCGGRKAHGRAHLARLGLCILCNTLRNAVTLESQTLNWHVSFNRLSLLDLIMESRQILVDVSAAEASSHVGHTTMSCDLSNSNFSLASACSDPDTISPTHIPKCRMGSRDDERCACIGSPIMPGMLSWIV